MKKLLFLGFMALMLAACSEDESTKVDDVAATQSEETQTDLNEALKDEAVAIDFVKANDDQVEKDDKVSLSGEVTNISSDGVGGSFTVTTTETDGSGMYTINNYAGTDVELNQSVTIYGTYAGKDDLGFPSVTATIIE